MEIKNNISNLTDLEDLHCFINNSTTCKRKFILFKYGLLNQPYKLKLWLAEDVKNIIIHKSIILEIQLQKFLRLVVEGEQDQAEAMLQENPGLSLLAGDVTDLSKRSFNNITGFQYAVWALDFHMWTMLLKYLEPEAIVKQLKGIETGSWVATHSKSASWQNLIDALDTYISLCNQFRWDEAAKQWKRAVGDAQALLPIHVVNEYCHPNRSFFPYPNFKDTAPLPRSRKTAVGEWFTATYKGASLGTGVFAYVRGWGPEDYVQATGAVMVIIIWEDDVWVADSGRPLGNIAVDYITCVNLLANRLEQQQALFTEYLDNKSQASFKLK